MLKGAGQGALFGAIFGGLASVGAGGQAVAALGGLGFSSAGIVSSAQRLLAEPNNECAWWDLGLSLFGVAASGYALGNALNNIGLPGGGPAPINGNPSLNSTQNEVMLSLNRGVGETSRIPVELSLMGRKAFSFNQWKQVGLSDLDANNPALFEKAFPQAMNKATRINFDITNLDITRAWKEGQNGIQYNYFQLPGRTRVTIDNVTNFEFYQIMTHPEWLGKTTFYRWEGNVVKWFTVNQNGELIPKFNP